jgi:choline-glycine betaine transporter
MIFLNILNFVGLSILKLLVVGMLFSAMGMSLVFLAVMEYLTKALNYLNDIYENHN